jgi:ribose 5-phosphate isomerase
MYKDEDKESNKHMKIIDLKIKETRIELLSDKQARKKLGDLPVPVNIIKTAILMIAKRI